MPKIIKGKLLLLFLVFINAYILTNLFSNSKYCNHFRINTTDSLHYYLFKTSPIENIERDMFVSLSHPASHLDLFKKVVGLPGDQIEIIDHQVFVNGKKFGYIEELSPSGLSLSPITESFIPEGFFFVHATHPLSFDSRYEQFGLVAKEQLKERLWPIF